MARSDQQGTCEADAYAPDPLHWRRSAELAVPLTPATHELIDAERLALMPPGAVLVNVGRSSTVDEQAVAAALDSGRLAGYGADVFAMEDRSRDEAPAAIAPALLKHPRSVFTPQLGSAVAEVRQAIEMRAVESILQALDDEQPDGDHSPANRRSVSVGPAWLWKETTYAGCNCF